MRPRFVLLLEPLFGRYAGWLVPTYAMMLALGSVAAAVVMTESARRVGYARKQSLHVLLWAYCAGLLGAWTVPLVQALAGLAQDGQLVFRSGMAAYGGLIGGSLGAVLSLRRQRLAVLPFLDAAAPALGLGYFAGRIGCFLAGCDYGVLTARSWGVVFPAGSHAFRDHLAKGLVAPSSPGALPVHPTQLYLAFVGLGLYLGLSRLSPRPDGRRFVLYVGLYALCRSAIELLRGDAGRGFVGALSTSQMLALASVVATAVGLSLARSKVLRSRLSEDSP